MKTLTPPDEPDLVLATPPTERGGPLRSRAARELRRAMIDTAVDAADVSFGAGGSDRLAVFTPMVTAVRVATTAISLLLASPRVLAGDHLITACAVLMVGYATLRSLRPIQYSNGIVSLNRTLVEALLHVGLIVATGMWESPFVFTLLSVVVIAGFARGFGFGVRIAVSCSLAVTIPAVYLSDNSTAVLRLSATWGGLLVLISLVSGYGRKVSGEADRERDIALDRLGRLADANALLYSLHRVAQTLPSSLDMNDVLTSTVTRLRELIDFDSVVILLFDDTDGHWQVIRQEGCHLPARLGPTDLPRGMRDAITDGMVVARNELGNKDGEGFDDRSGSGLYGALSARGSIMGLVALEHRDPNRFDHRSGGLLAGFVPPLAMALDNARWFARLRTVGADEERTRIARDLHDRIGQSLAYLAFELDRIVNRHNAGDPLGTSLEHLRDDVRGVIREVRDTLYDLRTDVSDAAGLHEILQQYADRVSERTNLEFVIEADDGERLPLLQEREMWRIAQEAITNIERHANAAHVRVTWRCDGGRAAIRISDDGIGFEIGRAGRLDSYGMLGMRERASSIGATLEVQSVPGVGTSITCVLDPSFPNDRQHDDRTKPGARR
ncbi:MAG TPA: sensor histidine kinase [Microthrixaceae bacterium]|nr:sensor histidine kinase [Microthrixaceae bacterium]HNI35898.1 sensor histidine kinase [Microthrixaceae bacterium]